LPTKDLKSLFYIYYTTGPGLVSRTYAERADLKDVHVLFPEDRFDKSQWFNFGRFGRHLMLGTWKKTHWLSQLWIVRLNKKSRELSLRHSASITNKSKNPA